MYDYTHCISDALEGITHSICSLEFENNRPLYDWVLDHLPVPGHPQQIEFARLNLSYTVLSKRKLIQLVTEKRVSGWDDPRLPTIGGIRRRGFTPESIRDFCERIGVSKAESMEGLAADYLAIVGKSLGVRFEPRYDIGLTRALELAQTGDIDLFPCLAVTNGRTHYLHYTTPLSRQPFVLIARRAAPITGVESLAGRTVAVIPSYFAYDRLLHDHPDYGTRFLFLPTGATALNAVASGSADAAIMFLDGELRRIAAARQGLGLRLELSRRLAKVEVLTARVTLRQAVGGFGAGLAVARQLVAWLRRR